MKKIFKHIVTLGPIGYLPAPGTCGTTLALLILYFLHFTKISLIDYALVVIILSVLSWHAAVQALDYFKHDDPSEIVIDEVIGCCLTFFMIPLTLKSLMVGFLLFRLFDIFKPLGLKKLESMGGAFGILADDVGAGIISNAILHALLYLKFLT